MNLADTEQESGSGSVVSNTANTRLTGSRLILARAVWLVLVIPSLGLFVASLPVYYLQIQRACVGLVTCTNLAGALPATGLQALTSSGFSVSTYAVLRNEVDLNQLSEQLVAVVQETMQPAHVSLWMRKPSRIENQPLQTGNPPS